MGEKQSQTFFKVNYNVFYYLIALAREVLSRQRVSSAANTDDLALAFGQAMLRPPNELRYRKVSFWFFSFCFIFLFLNSYFFFLDFPFQI